MNDLVSKLKQPTLWTISVQLLVLYVVSVAIFFGAHAVQQKAEAGLKDRVNKGEAGASAGLVLLALVLNFLGVAALVFVTRKTGENVRMAMMILPLFLIVEQQVRALRANPQERRIHLLGIAGVALGMIGGVAALMPHAPLK
jgi:cytochrome bd-type quinol oxidase subunit 2